MSVTLDIGSKIRLAPASKAIAVKMAWLAAYLQRTAMLGCLEVSHDDL